MTENIFAVKPEVPIHRQWIIVDLDGTVCDISHRVHLAKEAQRTGKPEDWDHFHASLEEDVPIHGVVLLLCAWRAAGGRIVYITARPAKYKAETLDWLDKVGAPRASLFMRTDSTPSTRFKEHAAAIAIPSGHSVAFVLEDRDKCVQMWRERGALTFHVSEGQY